VNYFSDEDYIAKIPGRKYFYDNDYEIKQVNCMSKRSEMTAGFIDHAILAPTYMGVMKHIIQNTEENYGFYTKNNR
jgi:hypothetical protein